MVRSDDQRTIRKLVYKGVDFTFRNSKKGMLINLIINSFRVSVKSKTVPRPVSILTVFLLSLPLI